MRTVLDFIGTAGLWTARVVVRSDF
jgi:hypothetical protein